MILGNCFNETQQYDLAIEHYAHFVNEGVMMSLLMGIINISQAYSRNNDRKEESVKRGLAFFMKYANEKWCRQLLLEKLPS